MNSDDPSSLSSNLLKSTFEEKDGTFWVATEKGLRHLRPQIREK